MSELARGLTHLSTAAQLPDRSAVLGGNDNSAQAVDRGGTRTIDRKRRKRRQASVSSGPKGAHWLVRQPWVGDTYLSALSLRETHKRSLPDPRVRYVPRASRVESLRLPTVFSVTAMKLTIRPAMNRLNSSAQSRSSTADSVFRTPNVKVAR